MQKSGDSTWTASELRKLQAIREALDDPILALVDDQSRLHIPPAMYRIATMRARGRGPADIAAEVKIQTGTVREQLRKFHIATGLSSHDLPELLLLHMETVAFSG